MPRATDEGKAALRAAVGVSPAPLSGAEVDGLVRYFQERSRACVDATKGGFLRGLSAADALLVALGDIWSRGELSSITAMHSRGEVVNSLRRACNERGIDFPALLATVFGLMAILPSMLDGMA